MRHISWFSSYSRSVYTKNRICGWPHHVSTADGRGVEPPCRKPPLPRPAVYGMAQPVYFPLLQSRRAGLHLDRDGRDGIAHLKGAVDLRLKGVDPVGELFDLFRNMDRIDDLKGIDSLELFS